MKMALGLALAGVSIALLAAPASARSPAKVERSVSRPAVKQTTGMPGRPAAPVKSGTDWDFLVGVDRASSPYGHDGY